MKKISKILIALLLAIVALFCVAGCNTDTQSELQSKIDELQSRIEDLQSQNEELEQELERKSDLLRENAKAGFYSLQEAYDCGFLTKTDLKDFCYYRFGTVWEGNDYNSETWTTIDYTPTRNLSGLDKNIETEIKELYYNLNEDKFYSKNEGLLGGIDDLTVSFFGEFNNSYVVQIDCSLWSYGAITIPTIVAGIAWWETGDGFKVYRTK